MSLAENCETNPGLVDCSWSTETPPPILLSIYLLIDPYFLPFIFHCLLLTVPNMDDSQSGISSFKYINLDGRTLIFASLKMDLGWR